MPASSSNTPHSRRRSAGRPSRSPTFRRCYEAVWGIRCDPRNFYRKVRRPMAFIVPAWFRQREGRDAGGRPGCSSRPARASLYPPMVRPSETSTRERSNDSEHQPSIVDPHGARSGVRGGLREACPTSRCTGTLQGPVSRSAGSRRRLPGRAGLGGQGQPPGRRPRGTRDRRVLPRPPCSSWASPEVCVPNIRARRRGGGDARSTPTTAAPAKTTGSRAGPKAWEIPHERRPDRPTM